jgi:hypothetical protein
MSNNIKRLELLMILLLLLRTYESIVIDSYNSASTKEELLMKFMMVVKASKDSEAGTMPKEQMEQMYAAMKKYNEELKKAGVLVSVGGLHPSSNGFRITYPVPGEPPVITEGPFAEVNELIAGYWFIDVKSREEAIEWAMRAPDPHGLGEGQIELRQVFE